MTQEDIQIIEKAFNLIAQECEETFGCMNCKVRQYCDMLAVVPSEINSEEKK